MTSFCPLFEPFSSYFYANSDERRANKGNGDNPFSFVRIALIEMLLVFLGIFVKKMTKFASTDRKKGHMDVFKGEKGSNEVLRAKRARTKATRSARSAMY